jgi:hypothetical protein
MIDTSALQIDVFELTAEEVALLDEDMIFEYMKRHEFRLASMNSRSREAMIEAMIEENNIKGGWFWSVDNGSPIGPYETYRDAKRESQG